MGRKMQSRDRFTANSSKQSQMAKRNVSEASCLIPKFASEARSSHWWACSSSPGSAWCPNVAQEGGVRKSGGGGQCAKGQLLGRT